LLAVDTVLLGRTGLRVTVMGLGGGGPSRLGQTGGRSEANSIEVVQRALELGVNFFDTAEAYGTEPIIGKALAGVPRDQFVLSTKKGLAKEGRLLSASEMVAGVEASLSRLGMDYLDIYHLHGIKLDQLDHARREVVPALLRLKEQGIVRWLGVTESFGQDTQHHTLEQALGSEHDADDWIDVVMVGFNLLNQSARNHVFPYTIAKNIGVLIMFAVRRTLSKPDQLATEVQKLAEQGAVDLNGLDPQAPLDFLVHPNGAESLTEAAYRYCRYEPGVHVVLSGTGNVHHLEENVRALQKPPLPAADVARVNRLFAGVDTVSGN
jgi:aryl-alcohol dehydrogenase-like predicted oxidoreductase